jgi:hypothetical protein
MDSVEGNRLGTLEREHARMEGRIVSLEQQMIAVAPVNVSVVRLEGAVLAVKDDIDELKKQTEFKGQQERALRVALIGLSGTILAVLIGTIVTVALAGHP